MRRPALLLALIIARSALAQADAAAPCARYEALVADARSGPAGKARAALAIAREPALAECAGKQMPSAWANPPDLLAWVLAGAVFYAGAENAEVAEAALPSLEDADPLVRATAAILCSCAVSSPPRCLLELRRLGLGPEPHGTFSSGVAPSRGTAGRVRAAVLALRSDGDGLDATLLARAQAMLSPPDAAALMAAGSWRLALDAMSLLPPPGVDAVVGLLGASPPSRGDEQAMAAWLQEHVSSDVLVDALGHGARSDGVIAGVLRQQDGGVSALARAAARAPAKQAMAALGMLKSAPDEDLAKVVTVLLAAARRPGLATSAAAPVARALVAAGAPLDAVARAPDGAPRAEVLRLLGREETITAEAVRAGLRSADRDVRRAALEAARDVSAEDAAALLPELLAFVRVPRTEDEVWDWRDPPGSFEDMRPPDPCPPEAERLDDLAIDALAFHEDAPAEALVAALGRGPHERAAAAWVVREARVELTPALTAALVRDAHHRDVAVRVAALAALEGAPETDAAAWTAVAEGMVDRSPLVRLVASRIGVPDGAALALDDATIRTLVRAVEDSAAVDPGYEAAERASRAGKVPSLDPGIEIGIESALRASGAAAVPALVASLGSPDPGRAAGILVGMGCGWGTRPVPEARSAVRDMLLGGNLQSRRALATAAVRFPDFRDLVAPWRDDPDPVLRAAGILTAPPADLRGTLDLALSLVHEDIALRHVAAELLARLPRPDLAGVDQRKACDVAQSLLAQADATIDNGALYVLGAFDCAIAAEPARAIAQTFARSPFDVSPADVPTPIRSAAVELLRDEPEVWQLVVNLATSDGQAEAAVAHALATGSSARRPALDGISIASRRVAMRSEMIVAACESIAWNEDVSRAERDQAMEVLLASGSAARLERLATAGPQRFRRRATDALLNADWKRGARVLLDRARRGSPGDRADARARLRYIAASDDRRAELAATPEEDAILDDALRCQ